MTEITIVDGNLIIDYEQIKRAASQRFKDLYKERLTLNLDSFERMLEPIPPLLNPEDNEQLCRLISEEEVWDIIEKMNPDKSPGPVGFSAHFYQKCWGIIRKDLVIMLQYIQKIANIGGSTNSTFFTLIPKDSNPSSFNRFMPISLCNVSYILFSKILAKRLKPYIPSLISPSQGGFVEKRQMVGSIILVQEAIHSSQTRKEKGMAIKLDMENALDRVRHNFHPAVLTRFGFNEILLSWISACIRSPWISPLVNGRPAPFFQLSRGLLQGCPISPILYILMVESLNKKLDKERENRLIPGIKISQGVTRINNFQFVDDTILLGGAFNILARRFKKTMDDYISASGGKVNELKSQIFAWNVPPQEM